MSLFDQLAAVDDLQRLIDERVPESDSIEYKTIPGKANEFERDKAAQDIAAFANSSGGVLIYGVATRDKGDVLRPTDLEPLTNWNSEYIQKHARDAIRRPIPNIRVKSIRASETHQYLLFDIPQSSETPHQVTTTKLYYRRDGIQNLAMAHDLIELYFGRRLHPNLEPHLELVGNAGDISEDEDHLKFDAMIGLLNTGGQIARDVLTRLIRDANRAPIRYETSQLPDLRQQTGPASSAIGPVRSMWHYNELYYPGLPKVFYSFGITVSRKTLGREKPLFLLDVYAEEMRPRRYTIFMTAMNEGLSLSLDWEEAADAPPIVP